MANDIAIKVDNVSKDFILPHQKRTTLKEHLIHPFQQVDKEVQHALNGVSLEINKGDFFGIVGRNGSGKSTLLKTIAGVYSPTSGSIQVNGKLVPFIELGVGFNPDLTARDNVYLNSALLGFSREETDKMYDEIVKFAELESHMDQKLKNFSSGMQVRLAFSIAIRAKSDILLLDEVLAVGDEAFQAKCTKVFEKYKSTNKTIILVTHDMATVKRFCTRAAYLENGELIEVASPQKVATTYTQKNSEVTKSELVQDNIESEKKTKTKLKLASGTNYNHNDKIELDIDWSEVEDSQNVDNIGVAVYKNSGEYVFGANTILDKVTVSGSGASYKVKLAVGPGNYHFKVALFGETDKDIIEFTDKGPEFAVSSQDSAKWEGLVFLEHDWSAH